MGASAGDWLGDTPSTGAEDTGGVLSAVPPGGTLSAGAADSGGTLSAGAVEAGGSLVTGEEGVCVSGETAPSGSSAGGWEVSVSGLSDGSSSGSSMTSGVAPVWVRR